MEHSFNLSTLQAEARRSVSSRPAWSTDPVPGLQRKTLIKKTTKQNKGKKKKNKTKKKKKGGGEGQKKGWREWGRMREKRERNKGESRDICPGGTKDCLWIERRQM